MDNTLYLECNSGISGDMTVAMLLSLGADEEVLRKTLATLPLSGYRIKISQVKKAGLAAMDFDVILDAELDNHDHDMEYLHGLLASNHEEKNANKVSNKNSGKTGHVSTGDYLELLAAAREDEPVDEHEHHHSHDEHHHDHHEHTHHHSHEHRGLKEVLAIIEASQMTDAAKALATRIFTILGEAEAKAHGETLETVHFHEVGAVDSIVDIAATAICLDNLQITKVIVPSLCEGTGSIRCAHGILPVPVPAVSAIVTKYQVPLTIMPIEGEFVTPTGAAIVAAIRTEKKLPERMTIQRVGLGAGKREYEKPSILRGMLIEEVAVDETSAAEARAFKKMLESTDHILKLETNIDDCTGEAMGFLLEELMAAGARDVHYMPVFMKKNRPGYELVVICTEDKRPQLEQIIFLHTTTIGIRRSVMERTVLPRTFKTVMTPYGDVRVKVVTLPSGEVRSYPEYEDVATICRAYGLGYTQVYQAIVWAADQS